MDKEALVDADIHAGAELIAALDAARLPIAAAMWLRRGEVWKFYIASPDVAKHGPISVYKFIDKALSSIESPIDSGDIVATNTTNHFVNALSSAIGARQGSVRFRNCTFNGILVEDAYVYRVAKGVRASAKAPKFPTKRHLAQVA
jgi:hypothetical protein